MLQERLTLGRLHRKKKTSGHIFKEEEKVRKKESQGAPLTTVENPSYFCNREGKNLKEEVRRKPFFFSGKEPGFPCGGKKSGARRDGLRGVGTLLLDHSCSENRSTNVKGASMVISREGKGILGHREERVIARNYVLGKRASFDQSGRLWITGDKN